VDTLDGAVVDAAGVGSASGVDEQPARRTRPPTAAGTARRVAQFVFIPTLRFLRGPGSTGRSPRVDLRTPLTFPLCLLPGLNVDDYDEAIGTLDGCNGTTVNGEYAYLITETYPFAGRCLNGQVSEERVGPPPGR